MRFAVIAALIATVSAAAGDACGKESGQPKGNCGVTACCGRTDTGAKVCSDDAKGNPDAATYTSFECMERKMNGDEEKASTIGVSAAVIAIAALYFS